MPIAVEFRQISKRFGKVLANDAVSFAIARGSIHGIIGENGAGKSTLMSILYGYYHADAGEIFIDGEVRAIRNSHDAIGLGIGMVHQHFMLVEDMTVLDNIMLGMEGGFRLRGQRAKAKQTLQTLCVDYQLDIRLDARIDSLSVGEQQRVEILKQLYRNANILILDEPTAVLTPQEADALFAILRLFKQQGKTVILITHKLPEILAITDEVTVMRAGTVVAALQTAHTDKEELAHKMVGRSVATELARQPLEVGATVLEVTNLQLRNVQGVSLLADINFSVRAGEIVAIAGVSGNGQSELLEILSGMRFAQADLMTGQVVIQQEAIDFSKRDPKLPARLRKLGVSHVPEDRLRDGVIKSFSVWENCLLGQQSEQIYLDKKQAVAASDALLEQFEVRPLDSHLRISQLSGGNQQKIVLAREIAAKPKLMLVGQPTRGVDIGTIQRIHTELLALRDAGVAILLVSAELEEIRALADRILVMSGGRITGELNIADYDTTRIGLLMGGLHK
ncbi:ABC transporter ATP-binding protein [Undibacterium fentianense]|uniref:ABC transporter ATP-binding protein n=1 Tax=Undibacterium fentianense TaxID=2828728 RepID=A0A941E2J2_9BURK|nr:ABC transporter ATP-binding protein [Undibacterium fentianense]MBR7799826.1 ABC transporter ATP-binding protein [Undibacterium fentianense]